jgi:hypothetical protein
VDALVGDRLISRLHQIRAGYVDRPGAFPQSLVLCGVRDEPDYPIHTASQEIITGGSAFNIKAKSLRLGKLGRDDCMALWMQHQDETGQVFDAAIGPELWEDTRGQPGWSTLWATSAPSRTALRATAACPSRSRATAPRASG